MNTISVNVDQVSNAIMLAEWLQNIRFVKDVTIDDNKVTTGNMEVVQKALDSIRSKKIFSDIIDS